MESAINKLLIPSALLSCDFRIKQCNYTFMRLAGFHRPEEIVGMHVTRIFRTAGSGLVFGYGKQLLERGYINGREAMVTLPCGKSLRIIFFMSKLQTQHTKKFRWLIHIHDLTL